jgi:ectoine hydroxylase-related dioxygenase (phytanoyl-CoA dioxygenase family)
VVSSHPLNKGFAWSDHTGPYRCVSPEQAAQYDRNGFFLLEGVVSQETRERLLSAIDPFEKALEDKLRELDGGRAFIARADEITFTTHLVTRSDACREFVSSKLFRDLCFDLLGPDVRLYWDQAVYKKPGTESPFPWHQDNGYAYVEPQQYLTCWVALTDADENSGCPLVVPGLHRDGTLAHRLGELGFVCLENPSDAVPVPARAGDVVVFSSLTPHCTGPNLTRDHVRKAYIVQFAPDGAVVRARDASGAVTETPADAPERQFEILANGEQP